MLTIKFKHMNKTKYTREERFKWYRQVDKYKRSVKEVCEIFGISRKTYYKWRRLDFGNNISRYYPAKNQPNIKLTPAVQKFITEQKLRTNYGPLKMKLLVKRVLGVDISTTIIYRFYKKKDLFDDPRKNYLGTNP